MNITKAKWFIRTLFTKFIYGKVGRHSYIGKAMYIQKKKNLFIGDNVRIYPGMRAEMVKETAKIRIGNNVSVGQGFHIVSYDGILKIGNNVTISGNVFISNVNHGYQDINVHSLEQELQYKSTVVGDFCFIGYGAVILPGTKLGKQCIVGANAVVNGEFPDYCVIAGNPARIIKTYNFSSEQWEKVQN